ncbi:MAG: hypothetical protein JWP87_1735 [Labilithrix sp.]|nr:hypothetical protein [Labilithrix sp.]
MQQRFRKLALFIGATTVVSGAFIVVACGTDNGTTATPPVPETGTKDTSPVGDGGGPSDQDGDTTPDGEAADCATAPILRSNTAAGGFFCAFYKAEAGVDGAAGLANCTSTQTCCNPGIADGGAFAGKFPPAFCADGKLGDNGCAAQDTVHGSDYQLGFFSNSWECNDKNGCPAGDICVMTTSPYAMAGNHVNLGPTNNKGVPKACGILESYQQGGSKCKTGAVDPTTEIQLCSTTDTGCPAGQTCKPFDGAGRDLGACRP